MEILKVLSQRQSNPHGAKSATMCFLGDSVTHGCFELKKTPEGNIDTVYEFNEAYCKKLEMLLKTAYPSAQLNVINSGISGDTAVGGLKRLDRDVLSFNPDFVSVCFGLNDCGRREEGLLDYLNSLDKIFKKLTDGGVKDVVFMTPNMMNTYVSSSITDPMFIEFAKNSMDIQMSGVLKKYIEGAKEVALENKVTICDCYLEWETMFNSGVDVTELLANKMNHPTRNMHWLFAHSLVRKIFLEK